MRLKKMPVLAKEISLTKPRLGGDERREAQSRIRPRVRFLCVELKLVERRLFSCVRMLEKCCRTAKYCKILQPNRTVESDFKRADARRMSFYYLLIGSATHRLAP
jgi:hypothetical protein